MEKTNALILQTLELVSLALLTLVDLTKAHLGVITLSPGVAKKARQQLSGLEALVRRLFLVMALRLEHEITPDMSELARYRRFPRQTEPVRTFSLFQRQPSAQMPDFNSMQSRRFIWSGPVPAAPVIERINLLKAVIEDADTHIRRMALSLCRQHEDQYPVIPSTGMTIRRLGLELSTIYPFLAVDIGQALRTRPPRAGPRPRPPPRLRVLDW